MTEEMTKEKALQISFDTVATLAERIATGESPSFDDEAMSAVLAEAAAMMIAIDDYTGIGLGEPLSVVVGAAAQLYSRTLKRLAYHSSQQSGKPN